MEKNTDDNMKKPKKCIELTAYEILGVEENATLEDIQMSYRKLIKKYHPDAIRGSVGDKSAKSENKIRNINKAYEILRNVKRRSEYDDKLKAIKKGPDFKMMKDAFKEFTDSQPKETKQEAEKRFIHESEVMDQKIGYVRDKVDPLDFRAMEKVVSQMKITREQDDIEALPDKMFNDGEKYDVNEFNKRFEERMVKCEAMIPYQEDMDPFNKTNFGGASLLEDEQIGDKDEQYDYMGQKIEKYIKPQTQCYDRTKDMKGAQLADMLEQMVRERDKETEKLHKLPMKEYRTDKCFGVSGKMEQIGTSDGWIVKEQCDEQLEKK